MNWLDKLKNRWNLNSSGQVWLVLLVFALTGTTVVVLRRMLKANFAWAHEPWFYWTYYWLILPFYNIILLIYGWFFGKFSFFWNFEKKFLIKLKKLIIK